MGDIAEERAMPASRQLEDVWLELVNVVAVCTQEKTADSGIVEFELTSLRDRINEATTSQEQAQLEACLAECQGLLSYYTALHKQKQRADTPGLSFSQLALE